tara:strand:+ start:44 stop:511 length:468 start_codon:yes stop_codon:yes gene_type:complete
MAKKSTSIIISTSIEEVWEVISEFDQISMWAENVDHSSFLSDQTEGVGSTRRIQMGSNVVQETVTIWEAPKKLSYEIAGLPPVFRRITNTWDLVNDGSDTRVQLTAQITPLRPPAEILAKVLSRFFTQINEKMLTGLKTHIEQTSIKKEKNDATP